MTSQMKSTSSYGEKFAGSFFSDLAILNLDGSQRIPDFENILTNDEEPKAAVAPFLVGGDVIAD